MKINVIKDIRYFESEIENVDGNSLPGYSGCLYKTPIVMLKNIIILVLKLREINFSLGGFNHLYINLSPLLGNHQFNLSSRSDPYHKWYRFVDYGLDYNKFNQLSDNEKINVILEVTRNVLVSFTTDDAVICYINKLFKDILYDINLIDVVYKEKSVNNRKVEMFINLTKEEKFKLSYRLWDLNDNQIIKNDEIKIFPNMDDLSVFCGTITINKTSIVIKSKVNSYYPTANIYKIEL